jgi:hypothetical protein
LVCTDDDECTLGTHNCDDNATCNNTDGSFNCSCNAGYTGDGVTCTADAGCTNGDTQEGTTVCGLNNEGVLKQDCINGEWVE